ncbi:TatD family [Myxozyma melibiosi]|uniref:TatD family n=1 Tax=Myxozyma melibiosi TaxID=54550 RepID=A0ABR1FFM1_9ASCO
MSKSDRASSNYKKGGRTGEKREKKKFMALRDHLVPTMYPGAAYIDTHCHLDTTLAMLKQKGSSDEDVKNEVDLANMLFTSELRAVVDVFCDIPVSDAWKDLGSQTRWISGEGRQWGGEYYFTMGCHPHSARLYGPDVEAQMMQAWSHPRCVAVGECGLDYKKNQSTQKEQEEVFIRQIEIASKVFNKTLVVHTREAEADTLRILKTHLPRNHRLHVHCFTDSAEMGLEILEHFPNAVIGITGVITFASLLTTTGLIRSGGLRVLDRLVLETDAPFMVPNSLMKNANRAKMGIYAVSHSGMIPATAEKIVECLREGGEDGVTVEDVLRITTENARRVYGL